MGALWAEKGHRVCFSHSRSQAKLDATVASAGVNAAAATASSAAEFGEVVLLAIHWPQVAEIVVELSPVLAGKTLMTCVVPWNAHRGGLSTGTHDSAAEEIARLAPDAHVVEALPFTADGLVNQPSLAEAQRTTVFYCGENAEAKAKVAVLLEDFGVRPYDAGDLKTARYLEPTMALLWHLAIGQGAGTEIAFKLVAN
jgi:predicted dinucleotide-binding enzyme